MSNNYTRDNAWFGVYSYFPEMKTPFFYRGGVYSSDNAGVFFFSSDNGIAQTIGSFSSFRVALVF